jgi:hypothetical protein
MKTYGLLMVVALLLVNCGKKGEESAHHDHEAMDGENPNQVLYNQVMDVHDEVMPKMEDLYNLKKDLQEKIANTPGLVEEERKKLEERIIVIDSVSKLMMDWMHEFNPLPDSTDQEAARAYLESEMEKIKKVKDAMLETLEKN